MSETTPTPDFCCPACRGQRLAVMVCTEALLIQEADGNLQTDLDADGVCGDHGWDDQSAVRCLDCGAQGVARQFRAEPPAKHHCPDCGGTNVDELVTAWVSPNTGVVGEICGQAPDPYYCNDCCQEVSHLVRRPACAA